MKEEKTVNKEKKPYTSPKLVIFGSVTELTQGTGGSCYPPQPPGSPGMPWDPCS